MKKLAVVLMVMFVASFFVVSSAQANCGNCCKDKQEQAQCPNAPAEGDGQKQCPKAAEKQEAPKDAEGQNTQGEKTENPQ